MLQAPALSSTKTVHNAARPKPVERTTSFDCAEPPEHLAFQPPFQLVLLVRDEPDDVFVQLRRRGLGLDVRVEAVFVFTLDKACDRVCCGAYNILYFHFDVIAFDHDFVTWNALLRWRPQNSAGFQVEIRTVPRTGDHGALNVAFRQRSAKVRAGVADGMVSSLHIEEGYFLAFDCERSRLAGWHVLGLSYLEKFFCHNA